MKKNYYSVWKTFNTFFVQLDIKPLAWEDRLILFVGYLIEYKKVQSQTMKSYISVIKTVLQDDGFELNEDRFALSALIWACHFRNDRVRARFPIKKLMCLELLYFLQQGQGYLAAAYMALFSTAYFGLLRVSEITLTSSNHAVRVGDVHISQNKRKILLILHTSKTHG